MRDVYSVYVQIDDQNRIIDINSDDFINDLSGWIKIDEGCGYKYHHAQGNYLDELLYGIDNYCFNYKLVDGKPQLRTYKEKQEEINNRPIEVSQLDKIEAQITYTAMMTNTLLGGESNV